MILSPIDGMYGGGYPWARDPYQIPMVQQPWQPTPAPNPYEFFPQAPIPISAIPAPFSPVSYAPPPVTPFSPAPVAPPTASPVAPPSQPSNLTGLEIGLIGGGLLGGIGSILGASGQNAASEANLQAQQQRQAQLLQLLMPMLRAGQDPYAGAYLQLLQSLMGARGPISTSQIPGATDIGPGGMTPMGGWPGIQPTAPPAGPSFGPGGQIPISAIPGPMFGTGIPGLYSPPMPGQGTTGLPGLYAQDAASQRQAANQAASMVQGIPQGFGQAGPDPFSYMQGGLFNPQTARLAAPFTYQAEQVGAMPQVQGERIAAPAAINLQQFNPGQDGLLQMMRRSIGAPDDAAVRTNLQRSVTGQERFDTSELFRALGLLDQRAVESQVADLRAGAGSLGERFGTAMHQNEARLRTDVTNASAARNAQIQQASFESAMARAMQGLGMQTSYQQQLNQLPFQEAGLQLQAGQAAGSLFNQGQGLNLEAQRATADNVLRAALANQQTGMQGQQINAAQALQAALANQGATNQAGQFNAQAGMDMATFNSAQGQQFNQLLLGLLGGAQGAQQQQFAQNTGLLSLLAGLPVPSQQPNAMPGAMGDIGQMLMLLPYLRGLGS